MTAPAEANLSAPSNQIEVWAAAPQSLLAARSCLQILDDHDLAEMGQITITSQRDAATAARVLLRLALSRASHYAIAASEWRFCRSAKGKPSLAMDLPQLHFSVAHCPSAVVVAVSAGLQVGIDVESIDQIMSDGVAQTVFSQLERNKLARLRAAQRARESLRLWTLKEAFTKLTGSGLSSDFASIEFSLAPTLLRDGQRARRLSTYFETLHFATATDLSLVSLAVGAAKPEALCGEIRLISLSGDDAAERAALTPAISI
ncbi:MAG TPA: 4'-phosphopantetheinyl transferase superfamily protein [Methylovirgula sp.]